MNEIPRLTVEHLIIVLIAVAAAMAVGIPLGVYCRSNRGGARIILRLVDAIQTIPSLALFGFLIPLPLIGGIGVRTAIIALTLYSLLPIVRNTVTGLNTVDPVVREAGVAMGMTPRQLLRQVEFPLAMPTIVAGIRIATVLAIGVATIAAAIGGGANFTTVCPDGGVMTVTRCAATSNTSYGVLASSAGTTIYVSDSTIAANHTGVSADSSGVVTSRGNNTLQANTSNGAFSSTFTPD